MIFFLIGSRMHHSASSKKHKSLHLNPMDYEYFLIGSSSSIAPQHFYKKHIKAFISYIMIIFTSAVTVFRVHKSTACGAYYMGDCFTSNVF